MRNVGNGGPHVDMQHNVHYAYIVTQMFICYIEKIGPKMDPIQGKCRSTMKKSTRNGPKRGGRIFISWWLVSSGM